MFASRKRILYLAVLGMAIFIWPDRVSASAIVNGDFETGDYSGWTLMKNGQTSTDGTWAVVEGGETVNRFQFLLDHYNKIEIRQTAGYFPLTFYAGDGAKLAAQLQNWKVQAAMRQDITLPAEATALSWDMSYTNMHSTFESNQGIAVHIRDLEDNILETIFVTGPESPLSMPMQTISAAIPPALVEKHQNVRLDVEVNVGINFLPVSFDNFRIEVAEVETLPLPILPPGWGMKPETGWQGALPPGLEKQDKIPSGFEKGQKNGFQR